MNSRILASAAIAAMFCGVLPARAADSRLVDLVMPDAKVVAGVNVDQARGTPFGRYVLSLIAPQDLEFQKMASELGFDPRYDVHEMLVASTGPNSHSGLALATGIFDSAKIAAAVAASGKAKTEAYKGVTIFEDAKQNAGVAFLESGIAIMGDLPSVRAAIDRRSAPSTLPASLSAQISHWSAMQDAWAVSIAPLSAMKPPAGSPQLPGLAQAGALQAIQQSAGGVKFGSMVEVTAEAQADTAQNATALSNVLQFLANLAMAQAGQDPNAAALLKSMTLNTNGNVLNIRMSLPTEQLQKMVKPRPAGLQRQQRRTVKQM